MTMKRRREEKRREEKEGGKKEEANRRDESGVGFALGLGLSRVLFEFQHAFDEGHLALDGADLAVTSSDRNLDLRVNNLLFHFVEEIVRLFGCDSFSVQQTQFPLREFLLSSSLSVWHKERKADER